MLSIETVSKSFGNHLALNEITFEVPRGRVVGFLGPNGAGKTTTMRAVLGLVEVESGTIAWEGNPIGPRVRRRFGYMPEERGLYPRMRMDEHLEFLSRLTDPAPGEPRAGIAARIASLTEELGVSDRLRSRVEELSFGNRQRVQLIAAMAHSPELLILDEPFSGLDPTAAAGLVRLIRAEASRGAAVLVSSHQMEMIGEACDDIVVIAGGEIRRRGGLEAWAEEAPMRRLRVVLSGEISPLDLPTPFVQIPSRGRIVTAQVPRDFGVTETADLMMELAGRAGVEVVSLALTPPTLGELFAAEVETDGGGGAGR